MRDFILANYSANETLRLAYLTPARSYKPVNNISPGGANIITVVTPSRPQGMPSANAQPAHG